MTAAAVAAFLVAYGDVIRAVLITLPMTASIAMVLYAIYTFRRDSVRERVALALLRLFRRPFVKLPFYEGDGPIVTYVWRIPERSLRARRYRAELSPAVQAWCDLTQTRIRLPIRHTDGSQVRILRFDSEADKLAFLLRWRGEGTALSPWEMTPARMARPWP